MRPQIVGQRAPDRKRHVWYKRDDGRYKCVLCGGVNRQPNADGDVDAVEPLTDKERTLCPPERKL